jgi:hypothetical protein
MEMLQSAISSEDEENLKKTGMQNGLEGIDLCIDRKETEKMHDRVRARKKRRKKRKEKQPGNINC